MQLAAAMTAPEQAGQQGFAPAHNAAAHEALAVGVVAEQALIPLELGPANVTLVMVEDQSIPGASVLAESTNDFLAAVGESDATLGAPEGVSPGIDRVGEDMEECVVNWQLPGHRAAFGAITDGGKWQGLLPHPQEHLADRLQFGELAEDQGDRLLDPPIRILLDAVMAHLEIAHGHGQEEFAPPSLLLEGFNGALTEERQLHLAHRALHAQQKTVVRVAGFVDTVLIDDQRADEAAKLQKGVPVPSIAREP